MRCSEGGEPLLHDSQLAEDVIVDVDLEAKDFALLKVGLHGVATTGLAFVVAG
jgi:hypothetical protein